MLLTFYHVFVNLIYHLPVVTAIDQELPVVVTVYRTNKVRRPIKKTSPFFVPLALFEIKIWSIISIHAIRDENSEICILIDGLT